MVQARTLLHAFMLLFFVAAAVSAQKTGDTAAGFAVGQTTRIVAPDGAASNRFGQTVAMDGQTAVIGAPNNDANRGAAYVFVRSGTQWNLEQKLTASDGQTNEFFGTSVAISGNTIIVGAPEENADGSALTSRGAAYIFSRIGSVWQQDRKIVASDRQLGDKFGYSVALSGGVAVIGAIGADVGGNINQGAVYVFNGSGTLWIEQTKIVAPDGETSDEFGTTLAVDGGTFVTGVPRDTIDGRTFQGSAYVYSGSGATWNLDNKLIATSGMDANDRFGFSVALKNDVIAVGAVGYDAPGVASPGAVFMFTRNASNWPFLNLVYALDGKTNDAFGSSVGLSGDLLVVGALGAFINFGEGAAYVFKRFGNDYFEQQKFSSGDSTLSESFGHAAAISGNSIIIGSPNRTVGTNASQGVAYAFNVLTNNWTIGAFIPNPFSESGAAFGSAVAISDDLAVFGVPQSGVPGVPNAGSAVIYRRSGAVWEYANLEATGFAEERMGSSIAVFGTKQDGLVVVGAPGGVVGGVAGRGRVVVLQISNGSVVSSFGLQHPSPAVGDRFGASVSIWDDTIVVGAPGRDVSSQPDQGSALVYRKTGPNSWAFVTELTANFGASFDEFGHDVDVFGTTIVASSRFGGIGNAGSVSVFTRTAGLNVWTEQTELIPADGAPSDFFGRSVAISGNTVVVGSSEHNSSVGAAYVFVGGGASWTQQAKITPSGPTSRFGWDVDINGNTAVISQCCSAPTRVYVYERTFSTWSPTRTLQSSVADDLFGSSVGISGSRIVVGLPASDSTTPFPRSARSLFAPDQGAAAIYNNEIVPTAAAISVGGRVVSNGRGVSNARVALTLENGETLATRTNSFGLYKFENITAGQNVAISVTAKGIRYDPRIVPLVDSVADIDFDAAVTP